MRKWLILLSLLLTSCGYTRLPVRAPEVPETPITRQEVLLDYDKVVAAIRDPDERQIEMYPVLHLWTTNQYGSGNHRLITSLDHQNGVITITIHGVLSPDGMALAVMQPAHALIELPYLSGEYRIQFLAKNTVSTGILVIHSPTARLYDLQGPVVIAPPRKVDPYYQSEQTFSNQP